MCVHLPQEAERLWTTFKALSKGCPSLYLPYNQQQAVGQCWDVPKLGENVLH